MLFKKRTARPKIQFERPRASTLDLNVAFLPPGLTWLPANAWEPADINYFAATAAPLQTQTLRGPVGAAPSKNRHEPQAPNIAGRWVLKLNPGQIAGKTGNATEQAGSPNKQDIHLGWAETHGHYSTFIRAELIIKIAGDPPVMTGENPIRRAVSELVAAHCVMLHSTGTLRIIPASVIDERILTAQFQPSEFISHQKLLEIGKFSSNPRLKECPQKIAIDIVPALWCESAEGKDFAKSMGWLVKRTKRERHLRQR